MPYTVSKAEVWAADIPNRPGTLARVLEPLAEAGAKLEFMIARKADEKTSRVFVAPIEGTKQKRAAKSAGLVPASSLHSIRIEGPDRPGLGLKLTRAIAKERINLRGASAAAVGRNAVFYFALDTAQGVKNAMRVARELLSGKSR